MVIKDTRQLVHLSTKGHAFFFSAENASYMELNIILLHFHNASSPKVHICWLLLSSPIMSSEIVLLFSFHGCSNRQCSKTWSSTRVLDGSRLFQNIIDVEIPEDSCWTYKLPSPRNSHSVNALLLSFPSESDANCPWCTFDQKTRKWLSCRIRRRRWVPAPEWSGVVAQFLPTLAPDIICLILTADT